VTICTRERRYSPGHENGGEIVLKRAGEIAAENIRQIGSHYENVTIDRFVIMPNHVHAIIVIEGRHPFSPDSTKIEIASVPHATGKPRAKSLGDVVGGYKAGVSRACRLAGIVDFEWQERFYDHILRTNASVNAVRSYIDNNPRNWIEDPERAHG